MGPGKHLPGSSTGVGAPSGGCRSQLSAWAGRESSGGASMGPLAARHQAQPRTGLPARCWVPAGRSGPGASGTCLRSSCCVPAGVTGRQAASWGDSGLPSVPRGRHTKEAVALGGRPPAGSEQGTGGLVPDGTELPSPLPGAPGLRSAGGGARCLCGARGADCTLRRLKNSPQTRPRAAPPLPLLPRPFGRFRGFSGFWFRRRFTDASVSITEMFPLEN